MEFDVTVVAPGQNGAAITMVELPLTAASTMPMLLEMMHDRPVLDDKGLFIFPSYVKHVWIDAGAHHCELTADKLRSDPTMGLIAIEANPRALVCVGGVSRAASHAW